MNIVLFEPEIPSNTGNIGRTCVLTHSTLHLIRPLGFVLTDKAIERSGLDYWPYLKLKMYDDWNDFLTQNPNARLWLATTKANQSHSSVEFKEDDFIVFGKESKGLPKEILEAYPDFHIRIPMDTEYARSLNLANSVAVVLYEALRQLDYPFLR